MRKLMNAQLSGTGGWAKLLLYRRDGAPLWALVHVCPLQAAAAPALAHATQRPAAADGGGGVGGGCGGLQLLLVADVTSTRLRKLGKYVVGKVLGQGASGVVRVGKNPQTGADRGAARRGAPALERLPLQGCAAASGGRQLDRNPARGRPPARALPQTSLLPSRLWTRRASGR